jgi:hypothetical protein
VRVQEIESGQWAIGGNPLTADAVKLSTGRESMQEVPGLVRRNLILPVVALVMSGLVSTANATVFYTRRRCDYTVAHSLNGLVSGPRNSASKPLIMALRSSRSLRLNVTARMTLLESYAGIRETAELSLIQMPRCSPQISGAA